MKEREIEKTLVLSTVHIPRELNERLQRLRAECSPGKDIKLPGTFCIPYAYGWILHVPEEEGFVDLDMASEKDLLHLLTLAKQLDCQYLRLDRDGLIDPDLPRYEW